MIKDATLNISQMSKSNIFTPNCMAFNTSLTARVYLQTPLATAVHRKACKILPTRFQVCEGVYCVYNFYAQIRKHTRGNIPKRLAI